MPVVNFGDALRGLADDMLETMYGAAGRGLAAPQVGTKQQLFVMDATWKEGVYAPQIFVNPVIFDQTDAVEEVEESCLSIPDTPCLVARPVGITLRWQDLDGTQLESAFDGFAARCIQHENDHLSGVLCTDYAL